jgi:hypothetical protein
MPVEQHWENFTVVLDRADDSGIILLPKTVLPIAADALTKAAFLMKFLRCADSIVDSGHFLPESPVSFRDIAFERKWDSILKFRAGSQASSRLSKTGEREVTGLKIFA